MAMCWRSDLGQKEALLKMGEITVGHKLGKGTQELESIAISLSEVQGRGTS